MKKGYPRLEEVMRRAGILGTPPLYQKIREKLIETFVDICYRREIDMMTEEFVYACMSMITDYATLYGTEGEERRGTDRKKQRAGKDHGADLPVHKRGDTHYRTEHDDGGAHKRRGVRNGAGYSGTDKHKQDRKPRRKTGKVSD